MQPFKKPFGQQPKPQKQKEDKCRVVIKKKKDGSVVKEISRSCSREHLRALSEIDKD